MHYPTRRKQIFSHQHPCQLEGEGTSGTRRSVRLAEKKRKATPTQEAKEKVRKGKAKHTTKKHKSNGDDLRERSDEQKQPIVLQASFKFDNVQDPKAWRQCTEIDWPDNRSQYKDGKKWYKANKDKLAQGFSGRKLAVGRRGVIMAQAR